MKVKVFNVGSCNGCDIEILAWSVEYGITLVDDPVKADVYAVSGYLTAANARRLAELQHRIVPRTVILVGTCAISQCLFQPACEDLNRFTFLDPKRRCYIYGCPPSPEEIVGRSITDFLSH